MFPIGGGTYVTTRPTMVATIPVGYADGHRRSLYCLKNEKTHPLGCVFYVGSALALQTYS